MTALADFPVAEAEREGLLGEIEGLKVSLGMPAFLRP